MRSETTLRIAPDHPFFAGHFPGTPIVPGVFLLDAVVLAMQQTPSPLPASGENVNGSWKTCQISSAKFLSPVGPGETLLISLNTADSGSTRFDISSGSRKVATGVLAFSSLP